MIMQNSETRVPAGIALLWTPIPTQNNVVTMTTRINFIHNYRDQYLRGTPHQLRISQYEMCKYSALTRGLI